MDVRVSLTMNLRFLLLVLFASAIVMSCLHREFIAGRVELGSTSDLVMGDSVVLYGKVFSRSNNQPLENANVKVKSSGTQTTSDPNGKYSLKLLSGDYVLSCQENNNPWSQLILESGLISGAKNRRIEVNFYLGYTIE
jgi:hypothetical protein